MVFINNYMQGVHSIFNGIKVNKRQIWEIEHCDVPKTNKLAFEIGIPVNEIQFSKTTIRKKILFSHKLMIISININRNQHRQNRCVLYNYNINTNYNCHAICSFCLLWHSINKNE